MTPQAGTADGETLLPLVLKAQQRSAEQLDSAHLREAADRLVELAKSLDFPLLLPVSRDAERLVGAAMLVGGSRINASAGGTYLAGMRVLLVDSVVVQVAGIASAAYIAKHAGAEVVGAVVLDHLGTDDSHGLVVHSLLHAAAGTAG
jgi:hypothetical protein